MTPSPVRPASTAETAEILKTASRELTPVVTTGGGTGLADATRPNQGELVLLTDRLNRLEAVDVAAGQVTVGAGVTLSELEAHAGRSGLVFPLDLGARQTATLGGMAATNAGGSLAWRFGSMRSLVVGIEAVLANGSVVGSLTGLLKDNAGYDLTGLLVGSEGTLAVITALRLKLVPQMPARATALVATHTLGQATELAVHMRAAAQDLMVCDFMSERAVDLACERTGSHSPLPPPSGGWLTLVELGGKADAQVVEQLAQALACAPNSSSDSVVVAADSNQREAIWALRDSINPACDATGQVCKLDLSVANSDLDQLNDAVLEVVNDAGCSAGRDVAVWGHLLDGNLHATLMGQAADEGIELAATQAVAKFGGSVAAEHGVGRQRLESIGLTRSADELQAMRAIKSALDPLGILSPGRGIPTI